jgi:ABC-type amino acid transport system permease subunit
VAELAALRATINDAAGRPGSPMEVLLWVALVFVAMVMVLSFAQNRLEKKWRIVR